MVAADILNNKVLPFLKGQVYDYFIKDHLGNVRPISGASLCAMTIAAKQTCAFYFQFQYVSGSSGFEQAGGVNSLTNHIRSNLPINKNGVVFFDNLQVIPIHGAILEESYYCLMGRK